MNLDLSSVDEEDEKYSKLRSYALSWLKEKGYTSKNNKEFVKGNKRVYLSYDFYLDERGNLTNYNGDILVNNNGVTSSQNDFVSSETEVISECSHMLHNSGEGIKWEIGNCIQYYLPAIYKVLYKEFDSCNSSKSSVYLDSSINGVDWSEILPSLLLNKYKWSKPMKSGKLNKLFSGVMDNLVGDMCILHIYMEGDNLVWV